MFDNVPGKEKKKPMIDFENAPTLGLLWENANGFISGILFGNEAEGIPDRKIIVQRMSKKDKPLPSKPKFKIIEKIYQDSSFVPSTPEDEQGGEIVEDYAEVVDDSNNKPDEFDF